MLTLYNRIQGRNLDRLAALSDGIFAVAMTLLVLDIHIPAASQVHSEGDLLLALGALGPQWIAYGMSFLTLGIFWAGQQTQLNHLKEGTRDLTWMHLGFLFAITMMPLSTRLLAEFIAYRSALAIYWLNIFVPGAMLYWSWGLRDPGEAYQGRHSGANPQQHLPANSHRTGALRRRRCLVPDQHVGEHRGHRAGPAELCCRTAAVEIPKTLSVLFSAGPPERSDSQV